jgi:hypothetical protein
MRAAPRTLLRMRADLVKLHDQHDMGKLERAALARYKFASMQAHTQPHTPPCSPAATEDSSNTSGSNW